MHEGNPYTRPLPMLTEAVRPLEGISRCPLGPKTTGLLVGLYALSFVVAGILLLVL